MAEQKIILENVLEDIFSYLPKMAYSKTEQAFPVVFGCGDEIELNVWLKDRESSNTYPLIWLLYPYVEGHSKTKIELDKIDFILAVDTNSSMQNKERIVETYTKVLMPLYWNMRYALKVANVINTASEYSVVKHPNYSKSASKEESGTIAIWDALKVTTNFSVIDTCLRPIKF